MKSIKLILSALVLNTYLFANDFEKGVEYYQSANYEQAYKIFCCFSTKG